VSAGSVDLAGGSSASVLNVGSNVYGVFPSGDVYPGALVDVPVYSSFDRLLETFTLDFTAFNSLQIASIAVNVAAGWSGTTASTGRRATVAYIRDGSTLDKGVQSSHEHLVTLKLRVSSTATAGEHGMKVLWNDTSNVLGDSVYPDNTSAVVHRAGVGRSIPGGIHVIDDALSAMFVVAEQGDLVNTAAVDGVPVTTSLRVVAARASRSLATVPTAHLTCSSVQPNIVGVNCTHAFLRGSETAGAETAPIIVRHTSGLTAYGFLSVWYPDLPITLSLAPSVVRRVRGWCNLTNEGPCRTHRYQPSIVEARATFRKSGRFFSADLSSNAVKYLRSSDGSVATVDPASGAVNALTAGPVSVMLIGGGGSLSGTAMLEAKPEFVHVIGVDPVISMRAPVAAGSATATSA
jgi:hypothetical protein